MQYRENCTGNRPCIRYKVFPEHLPALNNAIIIENQNGEVLTAEVAQHLGDDIVRCVAMTSTDGLMRGMEARDTGDFIRVPVGEKTLGRIFNVVGEPIDNKPAPEVEEGGLLQAST